MNVWDGKTSSFLRTGTNIIILNLLWFICSVPIITIGPATVAMVSVIRSWHLNEESSVLRCYFSEFRRYFKQGMMMATSWIVIGMILLLDVLYFLHISSGLKVLLLGITGMVCFLYLMTSAFLFPILVHYETKGLSLLKQAITFSFLDMKNTIAVITMWVGVGLVLFYTPLSILVIVTPVSMITFRFCMKSFEKINKLPKIQRRYVSLQN